MKKKFTKKLLRSVKLTSTQLVTYWILLIQKKKYRQISTDMSKQTKPKDPQQISLIRKLENQAHRSTKFFIIEKSEETTYKNSGNIW